MAPPPPKTTAQRTLSASAAAGLSTSSTTTSEDASRALDSASPTTTTTNNNNNNSNNDKLMRFDILGELATTDKRIIAELFNQFTGKESQLVATAVANSAIALGTTKKLFDALIKIEFERSLAAAKDEQEKNAGGAGSEATTTTTTTTTVTIPILRGNSLTTKIMDVYITTIGLDYFKRVLGSPLEKIMDDKELDLEVDPDKIRAENKNQVIEANMPKLIEHCKNFVDAIIYSEEAKNMPAEMSCIAKIIGEEAAVHNMEQAPLVGSFVLLRGFIPMVLFPDMKKITSKACVPKQRRNLLLISKVLQNLASGVEFGYKESYLDALNPLLKASQQPMNDFLLSFGGTTASNSNNSNNNHRPCDYEDASSCFTNTKLGDPQALRELLHKSFMEIHRPIMESTDSEVINQEVKPFFPPLERDKDQDETETETETEDKEDGGNKDAGTTVATPRVTANNNSSSSSSKGIGLAKLGPLANIGQIGFSKVRGLVNNVNKKVEENKKEKLDINYITPRVIAMAWPTQGAEAILGNQLKELRKVMEENHKDHYRVWNLAGEKSYDPALFHGRVNRIGFFDNQPPPFAYILQFCQSVDEWLMRDKDHVAYIHCRGSGKTRTAFMICAYLIYEGSQSFSVESALEFYNTQRGTKTVLTASQVRYLRHFHEQLKQAGGRAGVIAGGITDLIPMPYELVRLQKIVINWGSTSISSPITIVVHKAGKWYYNEDPAKCKKNDTTVRECPNNVELWGDIDVHVHESNKNGEIKGLLFHFWFNTALVLDHFTVTPADIDEEGKKLAPNFSLEVFLCS